MLVIIFLLIIVQRRDNELNAAKDLILHLRQGTVENRQATDTAHVIFTRLNSDSIMEVRDSIGDTIFYKRALNNR